MIDEAQLKEIDKKYKCDEWGKKSRFFWKPESAESLGLKYKEGRGYKVLVANDLKTIKEAQRIAIIQTYYANLGLAPRVYNIGWVDEYPCLEVELLKKYSDKFELPKVNFIETYKIDLNVDKNFMDGKYIDFHAFKFNQEKFKEWLSKEIDDKTHWGHLSEDNKRFSYQTGKRDMKYRIKQMKLDEVDFNEKKVIDVGCNLGLFGHYVSEQGGEAVGFDTQEIMNLAWLYKFLKKPLSNAEFMKPDNPIKGFDIQLYLAMVHTFGYPEVVADLTIFEGHNLQDRNATEVDLIKQGFSKVKFINYTEDRGKRPVFWCWR